MNPTSHSLTLPLEEATVRKLRAGDAVSLTGLILTGRDAVHKHLAAGNPPPAGFRGGAVYHCGPIIVADGDGWRVTAAGPTTSIREEPYMAGLIRDLGLRAVIGKGGMGADTLAACAEYGCVYLHTVGGAAQVLSRSIRKVRGVHYLEEFGAPEAVWELEVCNFPAIVTMDTHGKSLHAEVADNSTARYLELTKK